MTKARTLADFDASTALTGNINLATQVTGLLPLANGGTGATSVPAGATNAPAFDVKLSSNQNIGNATPATVAFDNEIVDTGTAFDTSTYKFTPQTAGNYFITFMLYAYPSTSGATDPVSYTHLTLPTILLV